MLNTQQGSNGCKSYSLWYDPSKNQTHNPPSEEGNCTHRPHLVAWTMTSTSVPLLLVTLSSALWGRWMMCAVARRAAAEATVTRLAAICHGHRHTAAQPNGAAASSISPISWWNTYFSLELDQEKNGKDTKGADGAILLWKHPCHFYPSAQFQNRALLSQPRAAVTCWFAPLRLHISTQHCGGMNTIFKISAAGSDKKQTIVHVDVWLFYFFLSWVWFLWGAVLPQTVPNSQSRLFGISWNANMNTASPTLKLPWRNQSMLTV